MAQSFADSKKQSFTPKGVDRDCDDGVLVELPLEEWELRDEGCEVFPSCLNCPLPRCLEEEPRGRQKLRKSLRARRMTELKSQGMSTGEIAALFGVSPRTVRRALKLVPNEARNLVREGEIATPSARNDKGGTIRNA